MRCANCGFENPGEKRFCGDCGAPLANRCQKCDAENPPGKRFCGDCGAPLAANAPTTPTKPLATTLTETEIRVATERVDAPPLAEGERKAVTALFADIKGSIELMEDLDPEDARRVVDPALRLMIDAAHRYDGYVVQSSGDGIFALFGAPVAHEDHPQRALLTALRMQQETRRLTSRLRAEGRAPLQIRVGLNTGEVVVRRLQTDERHVEYTPIGHTANLASRMQMLAEPGSVVVSEATHRLSEGYFAFRPLGPMRVKGVSEPVNVYEVTGMGPLKTRLQRAAGRGLTKFVGREREMAEMRRALELVKQGHGQIVAATGEAGLGKSRLFYEFKVTSQNGCLVLETFSVSHGKASAYLPVIELLNSYLKIDAEDEARKRREKITGKVLTLDRSLEDALPYLFALLSGEDTFGTLAQMDAQVRRRRTLDAIKRILLRESLNQPLIVVFEDLHWIDTETQAMLDLLADTIANARVLLLVNYRPEYRHGWGSKTYYARLRLDPLGQESAEELLDALLGDDADLEPLKRLIIEKTHANPFFMEETVQVLLDEGVLVRNGALKLTKPLSELRIPPTVQMILASRIDRLQPDEKDLLQTLAVMGKEFPLRLVKQVTGKADDELERILGNLQLGEFIYEQPALPDVEFSFKHSLTQEVAYGSVLAVSRRRTHERTAQALEALNADHLDDHLAELAHHYSRSSNYGKAMDYLYRAGRQSLKRSAYSQTLCFATSALDLLKNLPDDEARARQELALNAIFGTSLAATQGWVAPGLEQVYRRGRELCEQLGNRIEVFPELRRLRAICVLRQDFGASLDISNLLLSLAEQAQHPGMLVSAHWAKAHTLYFLGEFADAELHFEAALSTPVVASNSLQSSRALSLAHSALTLWYMGYPDRSSLRAQEALDSVGRLAEPFAATIVLYAVAWVYSFEGRPDRAQELTDAAISLAANRGLTSEEAASRVSRGWILSLRGHADEGIADMRCGVEAFEGFGVSALGFMYAFLAEGHWRAGQTSEGMSVVARGLELGGKTGERMFEPELHRLRGELLAAARDARACQQAEMAFRTALDTARRQEAKSWELRATMSLARLLDNHGKRAEARAMLFDIYNWFTEGFETADLKDAQALLDKLNA